MKLSIVIPARDAADTLDATLQSVRAQTRRSWEAIVVDDGSSDGTRAVAEVHAMADRRVRLVVQPRRGVSAARNAGLRAARHDWVLFLDADDWILPTFVQRVSAEARRDPPPDAVCTGWRRVTPDGRPVDETFEPDYDNIFDVLAQFCPFAIHSCVVRRATVERLGGFDDGLPVCEDWDLWMRIARTGARFARVDEVLACYRMRLGSAGGGVDALLEYGLHEVRLGHAQDPRVRDPSDRYAQGRAAEGLNDALFRFACWPAGLAIGSGDDGRRLLAALGDARDPTLSPDAVAHSLFRATLLPRGLALEDWSKVWGELEPRIEAFLQALEARSAARGLRQHARDILEQLVADHAPADETSQPVGEI